MALSETQRKIESKFQNSDGFLPYIEEIRFPMYKSLADDLALRLDWPIIALIGPNGTNKSSVLQAISAAPEGRSLAQFWFSTEVDDIDRGVRGKAPTDSSTSTSSMVRERAPSAVSTAAPRSTAQRRSRSLSKASAIRITGSPRSG